jgi:hypothetical protein
VFRLILFLSLFPIAIALIARWWFGLRVLMTDGRRPCRCDLSNWLPPPGDTALVHRAENSAAEFGRQLRLKALAEWRAEEPKAAGSRDKATRFGLAVPALSGIAAVFAVVVGKIPILGAVAIVLAATAVSAALALLALPPERTAISRSARKMRGARSFPRSEDEEAVVRCAIAHAWEAALPPILRWAHKPTRR